MPFETYSQFAATARFWVPKGKILWPEDATNLQTKKVIELYEAGFTGTLMQPDSKEHYHQTCKRTGGYSIFEDVAHRFSFADVGKDKLIIPYVYLLECFPGCLPGAAQDRGDCVSHAASGAQRMTIVGDVVGGLPDQVTGSFEGIPEVDPDGISDGVTSSEYQYWWRGYDGDGWDCNEAAVVSVERGCLLRNKYPDLDLDLTNYSGNLAGKYGRRRPPDNILQVGKIHRIHSSAEVSTADGLRDALANLHGIQTCGGEGFSSTRDKYGYAGRRGSWSHAYKIIGFDDRPEIKKIFGEPLVLQDNNWGVWNSGPRDIYNSASLVPAAKKALWIKLGIVNPQTGNIMIPPGSWWSKWSEVRYRSFFAYAGISGWPKKKLPDWGGSLAG